MLRYLVSPVKMLNPTHLAKQFAPDVVSVTPEATLIVIFQKQHQDESQN